jgi:hypothetical protein
MKNMHEEYGHGLLDVAETLRHLDRMPTGGEVPSNKGGNGAGGAS